MAFTDVYRDTGPMPHDPRAAAGPPARTGRIARLGRDTTYVLTGFPIALIGFILVLTLVTTGLSTLIIWVGFPIMLAALGTARALATAERFRLRHLDGTGIPEGLYPSPPAGASGWRWAFGALTQPQYWLDALWSVVGFVTATVAWCVAITWYAAALGGLSYWFWVQFLPDREGGLAQLLGFGAGSVVDVLVNTAVGLLALVTLPPVLRAMAVFHAAPANLLLNSRGALSERVDAERRTRQAHQDAEARALRRFERDIHDGPQQRLVRLSMDLGRAKKQLHDDPELAAVTIDAALQQTRDTVDELRSLTRGIAPPLLVDRGLEVALDEVINRAELPVTLDFDVSESLSPAVETAVYFTVSEALTNIAKHSLATRADVTVRERDGIRVDVVVADDGMGGAHESKGTGLRGLRSRIEGVGGLFEIDSPVGGPTTVSASLPVQ